MHTIPEIKNFPAGAVIEAVQGKISAVYERRNINGQHGPTTVQNAELQDGAGNKIKLSVWDHPDLTELKGKEYVLHSSQAGAKRVGVSVKHGSYTPKNSDIAQKTIELTVNKKGVFQYIQVYQDMHGKQNGSTPIQSLTPTASANGAGTQGCRDVAAPAASPEMVIQANAARLRKTANLWLTCYEEALYCQSVLGGSLTPDQFQSCVASLYIQASRDNIQVEGGTFVRKADAAQPGDRY